MITCLAISSYVFTHCEMRSFKIQTRLLLFNNMKDRKKDKKERKKNRNEGKEEEKKETKQKSLFIPNHH